MSDTPTLGDTMDRVKTELKNKGKTKVDIESEAAGSASIAEQLIKTAANVGGLKVKTKVNKKSVTGTTVEDDN